MTEFEEQVLGELLTIRHILESIIKQSEADKFTSTNKFTNLVGYKPLGPY